MFNVGQSPAFIFSPICIQIHSNRINHVLYSEPTFPAPQLYLLRHTLMNNKVGDAFCSIRPAVCVHSPVWILQPTLKHDRDQFEI